MFYFIYFSYILECIIMYQWQNGSTSPGDTDLQSTFDSRQKSIHIRRFCVLCAKNTQKWAFVHISQLAFTHKIHNAIWWGVWILASTYIDVVL